MYKWTRPFTKKPFWQRERGHQWYISDFCFDKNEQSYQWKDGYYQTTKGGEYNDILYNNKNLKLNWNKLSTHIVHITDVAIHEDFRGKGLGTQLVQSMIYSFPSGTRFGLEVWSSNHGAIKCYEKCGVSFNFYLKIIIKLILLLFVIWNICSL